MRNLTSCGDLIINGKFGTGLAGWTVEGSTTGYPIVIDGTAILATASKISQTFNLVAGTKLTFSYDGLYRNCILFIWDLPL